MVPAPSWGCAVFTAYLFREETFKLSGIWGFSKVDTKMGMDNEGGN